MIGVGMFAALAMSLMLGGEWTVLEAMGVSPMDLPWADARTITGAGLALEQGLDPLVTNPGDPWHRVMNYPRPWLALANVGFRPEHTWILAWAFFASLLVGLVILRPLARDRTTSYLLLLSIFAPTTWLAIERANNDAFVFGIVCVAAYLIAIRPVLASILIATAALLKVYPIVALAAHLREKPHTGLKYAAPLLGCFAAYVLATWNDLQLIQTGTLKAPWLAYGIEIAPSIIAKNSPIPLNLGLWIAAFSLLIICTIGYGIRLKVRLGAAGAPFSLAAFRIGSAIYLGSFLIGSSFDYRLIFLILTIPQLVTWARNAASGPRQLALSQLIVVILLQWSQSWRAGMANTTGSSSYGLVLDELLTWLCWAGLAVLTLLTLPDWLVPRSRRGLADAERQEVMTVGARAS
jgi:hypothetical protein